MIFESLYESSQRNELMLVDGGFCHWHLRRDGQLTICEIISTKRGAGSLMLRRLMATPGATSLFAKCPAHLEANVWYGKRGFVVDHLEHTKSGKALLCWKMDLTQQKRRPTLGDIELIYCGAASRLDEIALDNGFLYGSQLPKWSKYRPYFVDQDWKRPQRHEYMLALAKYKPHIATVLDLERWDQIDEVLSWAAEATVHAQVVVIIPKVNGVIAELPRKIHGAQIRLGYSVPTKYAGTTVPLSEFGDWPVHLLGGSPTKQIELSRILNVKSADQNYIAKLATEFCKFWGKKTGPGGRHLSDDDGMIVPDAMYEAFRRSCVNVMAAWREVVTLPKLALPNEQLPLFAEAHHA